MQEPPGEAAGTSRGAGRMGEELFSENGCTCEAGMLTSVLGGGWERDPTSSWPALTAGVCLTVAKLLNIAPVKSITQLPCFPETHWHGKASALGH